MQLLLAGVLAATPSTTCLPSACTTKPDPLSPGQSEAVGERTKNERPPVRIIGPRNTAAWPGVAVGVATVPS